MPLIIWELNNDKATGINSIPLKILKLAKQPISNHLSKILIFLSLQVFFQKDLNSKCYSNAEDSKLEFPIYRPILLLSNVEKIIEKIMHKRVMQFLNEHNILYQKHFGFQNNISTDHAITKNNWKVIWLIFFDLQKAFDTADHNI